MKSLVSSLFLVSALIGFAQPKNKYWIQLADKSNTPFHISNPEEFLSKKAVDRRVNQLIPVDFKDLPIDPAYVEQIASFSSVTIRRTSKWLNSVSVEISDSKVLDSIIGLPFVYNIDRVRTMAIDPRIELPLKSTGHTNYHDEHYGMAFRQIEMHSGHLLHNLGFTGAGITIAVLDAGFDKANEIDVFDAMREEDRLLGTRDFVDGDNYVYHSSQHGTAVLSCMGAKLPGKMVGTAPDASYILIRTEDVSSESLVEEDNWVAGAEYADSMGADILNTSLGYTQFDDSTTDHTYADMDGNTTRISIAADIAASKGILVVTSAGNMGSQPWHYISAPADADSSLAVAAVDSFLIRAPFSSYGPSSDGDLKPNVAAMGYKAACTFPSGEVGQANGTSFSSPILAGMAACLWQSLRGNTNIELKELIERNGHQYSNPDFSLGYGVPNFYTAYLEGNLFSLSTSDEIISVFPTHFNDKLTVHFHSQESGNWKLNVLNSLGQILYQKELHVATGEYVQTVFTDELLRLNMGTYLIQFFKDDVKIAVKKIFKIKS